MKKIILITLTVILNTAFFSCSPDAISDDTNNEQMTSGIDGEILPSEDSDDRNN